MPSSIPIADSGPLDENQKRAHILELLSQAVSQIENHDCQVSIHDEWILVRLHRSQGVLWLRPEAPRPLEEISPNLLSGVG